jgi:hypothetical protein
MGRLWYGFLVMCFVVQAGAALAETTDERLQRLEQTIENMKKHEASEREIEGQPPATKPGESPNVQQLGAQGQGAERKYGSIMQGSGKLIYARPFVSNPKAIVGGYTDFEYINRRHAGGPSTMEVHRFVPFIYGDISEHVKFAAEIEIEHGILERSSAPTSEVSLEFATIDYLVNDKLNLRAGVLLLPVGKFNLLHDAPLRDLTERPLVDQMLYGVVLSETGAGAYGTFYPTRQSKLDYEVYVTTGYNGFGNCQAGSANANSLNPTNCPNAINERTGISGARQRTSPIGAGFDNNNGKAVVGRVAFSPFLGVEIGGSGYTGTYDPFGNRRLTIAAVDWTLVRGPFEVIGESIWTYVEDNNKRIDGSACLGSNTANVAFSHTCPQRMQGYYIQGNYHFLPEWMTRLAPSFFRPEVSTFTTMVRWEQVNTNLDQSNGLGERQRVTFGVNYRPTEDTVFKLDFQYSPKEIDTNNNNNRIHDRAILLSAATYF